MIPAENIREWLGHDVRDAGDDKIGELEAIYVDTRTDQPAFATVKLGFVGRRRLAFVPLHGATVGPDYLKVVATKDQVKSAPAIDTDGELPADDEEAIYAHYELPYQKGSAGERRLARR